MSSPVGDFSTASCSPFSPGCFSLVGVASAAAAVSPDSSFRLNDDCCRKRDLGDGDRFDTDDDFIEARLLGERDAFRLRPEFDLAPTPPGDAAAAAAAVPLLAEPVVAGLFVVAAPAACLGDDDVIDLRPVEDMI